MEFKELKTKNSDELNRLLEETRESLREMGFGVRRGDEKGVRQVRVARKLVAQILTLLNKQEKHSLKL